MTQYVINHRLGCQSLAREVDPPPFLLLLPRFDASLLSESNAPPANASHSSSISLLLSCAASKSNAATNTNPTATKLVTASMPHRGLPVADHTPAKTTLPTHANPTVHTPTREKNAASYPCGMHCWNIPRSIGKMHGLTRPATAGSAKISHRLFMPMNSHSGQIGVSAFNPNNVHFIGLGRSFRTIGTAVVVDTIDVTVTTKSTMITSVAVAFNSLCTKTT
eukprot:30942-Pelagococcus_subviridis.AAC.4